MSDPDINEELRRLSARLDRLERLLDLESLEREAPGPAASPRAEAPAPPPLAATQAATPPATPPATLPATPPVTPPVMPPRAAAGPARRESTVAAIVDAERAGAARQVAAAGAAGGAPPRTATNVGAPHSAADRTSIELAIGGRWMAWVGAIAVVIGIGLFIKFAYDEGWLRFVSLSMRCAMAAAFGAVLIVCGEIALRKVGRNASVGLFGAGLGTLYVTALVAFRLEVLGSAGLTLLLLAFTAALGIAIALRAALLSIAVVSILAGYAAPLLVPGAETFAAALPTYLTMLLAVGLALSAWRPRPFRTLRLVACAAHAAIATMWLLETGSAAGLLELTFLSGWWMMVTGEALYAAIRRQSSLGNAILSLAATSWYVLFGCVLLHTTAAISGDLAGAFTAGVAVLAGAIAFQFGPGLEALRRRPRIAIENLAASLWAQAASLLVIAAGLQFDDHGVTLAWLIMGLGAIEIGRRLPSLAADVFGLFVAALGFLRLVSVSLVVGIGTTAVRIGGHEISEWGLLALAGTAIVHAAAWRLRPDGARPWRGMRISLAALSAALWILLTALELPGMSMGAAWLAAAAALIACARVGLQLKYLEIGAALIAAASLRLVLVDLFLRRTEDLPEWIRATPFLNKATLFGAAIIAAGAAAAWMERRLRPVRQVWDDRPAIALRAFLALLTLLVLSFETDRAVAAYEAVQSAATRERWGEYQLASLALALLWGLTGVLGVIFASLREGSRLLQPALVTAACAAIAWLAWGTLYYRIANGAAPVRVLFNAQFLCGLALGAGLAVVARIGRGGARLSGPNDVALAAPVLVALIGLWLGSLEIDRFFNPETSTFADAAMARQTGLSIYWGVYGIALVVIGFAARAALSRYAGLGLLTVTLLKVLIVDMGDVEYIYRVLSFIGVGLLFVLTSIAYAKLSPRLLGELGRAGGPDSGTLEGGAEEEARPADGPAGLA